MGGKNCGEIHMSLLGQREGYPSKPLVEMGDHRNPSFMGDELVPSLADSISNDRTVYQTYFTQEPCYQVSKDNRFIGFGVCSR